MSILKLSEVERDRASSRYRPETSILEEKIASLKEWMCMQPHLPQLNDDIWLESFLSGCRYNVEKCKEKLDKYFSIRTALPSIYSNRDPMSEETRKTLSYSAIFPLGLHPNGSILGYAKALDYDGDDFCVEALARRASMFADCIIRETSNLNATIIVDLEYLCLRHALKLTPSLAKNAALSVIDAYPFTLKDVYVINTPNVITVVQKVISPFLPTYFQERVHFYSGGIEEISEFLPLHMLPSEYGGKAGTIAELNEKYQRRLESCRDWFLDHTSKLIDEEKRPDNSLCETDFFNGWFF